MARPLPTAPNPLILFASADAGLRTLACDALGEAGFSIVEAADAEAALERYGRSRPGLVVVDAELPPSDGVSLCQELRRRHPEEPTPVLVLTGVDAPDAVERAYEAGATDFAVKPIQWPLLCQRVRYLVRAGRHFAELQRSRVSLDNAQRIARLGSWELDCSRNEMHWSPETFRVFGLEPDQVVPNPRQWWDFVHPEDRDVVRQQMREALDHKGSYSIEHRVLARDGGLRYVRQAAEMHVDAATGARWLLGTLQDVTEQKQATEQIWYLANFDSLTGLANRRFFGQRLEEAIDHARETGTYTGVLYMDLDRFKQINDTLGHSAGDVLLRHVADLLRRHVRGTDVVGRLGRRRPEGSAISRLGGDEFTILLWEMVSPEAAGDVARRILQDLPSPVSIEGREVSATGSIGIALFPTDGTSAEDLMKAADTAMYHAKERGRNNYQFFCPTMTEALLRKMSMESHLRRALATETLDLHFQPKIDLRTGAVTGAEALLRWSHPELGTIPPKEIIPLAEETGLIGELGAWVLREAIVRSAAWRSAGWPELPVAVNVSARQFARSDLQETVGRVLRETGLDPRCLEIEITETLLLQDDESVATALRDLRAMGVRVALDDFGTGYSSLSYLTRFPLDSLKMDRAFIRDVDSDPAAEGVVRAVVAMAHSLQLRIVAEGVDVEEQARLLRELGCDEVQGFLFSGALSAEEFLRFLSARRAETRHDRG